MSPLISIIDDDESTREAVAGLVRALGFTVIEFDSAAAFLQSGSQAHTACLIVDMRMPGMTGLELHRHLVTSDRSIPTILVTAYPEDAVRIRAAKAGIRCYLAKPIEPETLLACIHSAFEESGGATE